MLEYTSTSPEQTRSIAKSLAREIYSGTNICFFGEMGSGKTQMIQAFLEEKGVKSDSVSSPSYTIAQQYKNANEIFVHIDLYRLENEDDLGIEEDLLDEDKTVLLEWAERLTLLPSPGIEVHIQKLSDNKRKIQIHFSGFTLEQKAFAHMLDSYKIPPHVQLHTAQVARVSLEVGKNLINHGYVLDLEIIKQAALLHDLVRYIDFKGGFNKKKFNYHIDEETWIFWKEMRSKHKGKHHADLAHEILSNNGYSWLGKIILAHKCNIIFEGFNNTYEKIIHYADKRCCHDTIVTLDERFSDLRERYGSLKPDDDYWEQLTFFNKKLEEELLAKDISFEDKQRFEPAYRQ